MSNIFEIVANEGSHSPTPPVAYDTDDDDERLSISNMELVDEVNGDDSDDDMMEGPSDEPGPSNVKQSSSETSNEQPMSLKKFDQVSKELRTLQFRNPGGSTPDALALLAMNSGHGRLLRSSSHARSETPDSVMGHDELYYDNEGKIVNPTTGQKIYLCDCLDFDCKGCYMQCEDCGSPRCFFQCQRGRQALIWSQGNSGVKKRNPFVKQFDDEEAELKWKE
uniref:ARF7EP_C domain-containing protein n=1 Tax=Steinernema glaseri TaxID=37863 RepID=A0A1I7ZSN4_9BILA